MAARLDGLRPLRRGKLDRKEGVLALGHLAVHAAARPPGGIVVGVYAEFVPDSEAAFPERAVDVGENSGREAPVEEGERLHTLFGGRMAARVPGTV